MLVGFVFRKSGRIRRDTKPAPVAANLLVSGALGSFLPDLRSRWAGRVKYPVLGDCSWA